MFNIINTKGIESSPRFVYAGLDATRRRWMENIVYLRNYYQNSGVSVSNTHPLVNLLESMTFSPKPTARAYYDAVRDSLGRLSTGSGIVTPINSRSVISPTRDSFYGNSQQEILLSADFDMDPAMAYINWQNVEAVRVMRCPVNDLNMAVPDGTVAPSAGGISIIYIDIPLLAIQYLGWLTRPQGTTNMGQERTGHFVAKYVLPNMLVSQTNVAIFNRLAKMWLGDPVDPPANVTPISIPTNYTGFDQFAKNYIAGHTSQKPTFRETLHNIPLVRTNGLSLVANPNILTTRQNEWAIVAGLIPYLSHVLSIDNRHEAVGNLAERVALKRYLKVLAGDRGLANAPTRLRNDIQLEIDLYLSAYL